MSNTIALVDTPVAIVVTDQPNPLVAATTETGRDDVVVYLSDTPGGSAIHASLSKTATETTPAGTYLATFEGADLLTHLDAYIGRTIYRCVQIGTHLMQSTPLQVIPTL